MRVFVDTNVFVYLFDAGAPAKQQRAREVVGELARARSLVLSSQVLSELYVTVTRKLAEPLPVEQALRAVDDLAAFPVVAVDAALGRRAAAHSALRSPISSVVNRIWRCRLESSTTSSSTMPTRPTPAATM